MPSFEKDLPAAQGAALSDAQFKEICRLLQPGFELSTMMLADYTAQRAEAPTSDEKPLSTDPQTTKAG